jgi:hypothetical protein
MKMVRPHRSLIVISGVLQTVPGVQRVVSTLEVRSQ